MMVTSNSGIEMIKRYEGFRPAAYFDPAGVLTIGYGHTSGVTVNMTCTEQQATEWLKQDLRKAEMSVTALERWGYAFNQSQFDALVSFTFNCGAGNLAKLCGGGSRTIEEIAEKIKLHNKAGGVVLNGLTKRRQEESTMLIMGMQPSTPAVTAAPVIFKSIALRANYRVRNAPSDSAAIIGRTDRITVSILKSKTGHWIETEHGFIHEDAFYDKFI